MNRLSSLIKSLILVAVDGGMLFTLVSISFVKFEGHAFFVKGVVALPSISVPGQRVFHNYSATLARVGY